MLRLSIDESRVLEGPVNCLSLRALIWCKWLKSLELTSWILVRIDCTKIAGQILDNSERHCRICLSRPSRFWHIALIVILIILREKEFNLSTLNMAKVLTRMRKRRCMKIGAKTLRNNFRIKATADEFDVTTKPSFSEDKNGQTES